MFSSLAAARRLLEDEQLKPFLLLHPNALPEFEGLPTSDPNAVVVGLAKEAFSYENMNRCVDESLDKGPAPQRRALNGGLCLWTV